MCYDLADPSQPPQAMPGSSATPMSRGTLIRRGTMIFCSRRYFAITSQTGSPCAPSTTGVQLATLHFLFASNGLLARRNVANAATDAGSRGTGIGARLPAPCRRPADSRGRGGTDCRRAQRGQDNGGAVRVLIEIMNELGDGACIAAREVNGIELMATNWVYHTHAPRLSRGLPF